MQYIQKKDLYFKDFLLPKGEYLNPITDIYGDYEFLLLVIVIFKLLKLSFYLFLNTIYIYSK